MKKMFKVLPLGLLFALISSPSTALAATGGSDAVVDILNNGRYEGAIDSIKSVTEVVDVGFTMFITFVAFFIISAAMLRNVLAGAYCAFPKFWDKVDASHKEVAETGWVTRLQGLRSGYQNINIGSLAKSIMRILPNIKALTDFEDNTVEPKSYFIKGIPQMIGVIIIGVFIYNGYYRDTASTISNFGSELFERMILSADPIAIFDRITGASGKPEFASDNSLTDDGKLINKLSQASYSKVIGTYTDIKGSAAKTALATQLEAWVKDNVGNRCGEYIDRENWSYTYDVTLTMGKTSMTDSNTPDGLGHSVVFSDLPIATLNLDSTKEVGVDWHLTLIVNFKKKAADTKSTTVLDLTMNVKGLMSNSKTLEFTRGGDSRLVVYANSTTIGGKPVSFDVSTGTLTFTDGKPSGTTWDCAGLGYKGSNGKTHKITTIKFSSGSNTTCTATLSSQVYSVTDLAYGTAVPDDLTKRE